MYNGAKRTSHPSRKYSPSSPEPPPFTQTARGQPPFLASLENRILEQRSTRFRIRDRLRRRLSTRNGILRRGILANIWQAFGIVIEPSPFIVEDASQAKKMSIDPPTHHS